MPRFLPLAASLLLAVAPLARADDPPPTPPAAPALAEPSISPGRKEIAFVSGGDVWTVPFAGGEARLLVSHPANESRPLWSPDGTRLAFVSTRTGNGDVYVLTLATGALQRITFDDVNDQLDAWSRDGKWLYFSSTSRDVSGMSDVWRVSASGGTPMQVAGDRYATEYWGAPSPDGATLAITARGFPFAQWWRNGHSHLDESEVWLVRDVAPGAAATPRYEPLTAGGAKSGWPMWSPDGVTVYFMSDRSGAENLWSRSTAATGAEPTQLTRFTSGRVLWPSISYDGQTIVFERDFGIWTYDVTSGKAAPLSVTLRGAPAGPGTEHLTLTNGIQQLALSPDGKKVAFVVRGEVFAASAKDGGDATRVTATTAAESQVAWSPDSRRLAYASDRDGPWHVYVYDFATRSETQLTRGPANDVTPYWSPDGKSIAFVRGARELRVADVASHAERLVATAYLDRPPFISDREVAWSPDSRWLAFHTSEGPKQFSNVFVAPASGCTSASACERHQVSWLPHTGSGTISWSPDGRFLIAGSGQRTENGQAVRIDLVPRTPRFREEQFRELFGPDAPRQPSPQTQQPAPGAPSGPAPTRADSAARRDSAAAGTARRAGAPPPATRVVFDDIRQRSSALNVGVDINGSAISPDGKTLLLVASVANQTNLYTYSLDELAKEEPVARQLTSTPGFKSAAQWSADGKEVYYLEAGRINAVAVDSRAVRPVAVTAEMDADFAAEKMEVFAEAWSYLRDNFFDSKMNGVDWSAAREAYGPRVAAASTPDEMRRVMNLMVGELNASHSGIGGPPAQPPYTGRLGLRFDRAAYERDGTLRVAEVVPFGPAAVAGRVAAGDVLVAVEGRKLDAGTNLDELLAYRVGRQTTLTLSDGRAGGSTRQVTVRPVNGATDKALLYRAWVESRRAYVAKASGGRLGYVHMPDMSQQSLNQLYADLDAENQAREGVVVDVRNNNGGFVNAYALDVFTRRPYLGMQVRDLPTTSARTRLGQRSLELPTVLVTNQHSLSDAEDFTEGYRAMGLGKVVGEPTAGWIVYTSNTTLLDGTTLRLPFTRITDAQGRDMEMHPRPVDELVVRPIGESYTGRDAQLDAAVKTLLSGLPATRRAASGGTENR